MSLNPITEQRQGGAGSSGGRRGRWAVVPRVSFQAGLILGSWGDTNPIAEPPVQAVNGLGTVRTALCCQVLRWSICSAPKACANKHPFGPSDPFCVNLEETISRAQDAVGLRLALLSVIQRLWANYFLPWIFQSALGRQGKQVGWVHGQSPPLSGVFLQMEVGIG